MKAAGVDGIELEAYGHLLDQFWSPLTNDLEAPYGGTLENRLRFTIEVLAAIRERCGPDFIVGLRYTGDRGSGRRDDAGRGLPDLAHAEGQRTGGLPERRARPYRHRCRR